jgi:hypothetical protein
MQFNPACLSGTTNSNVACASQGTELFNHNLPTYSDPTAVQNGWQNIITTLPFYGIYNSGLVAVPTTTSTTTDANHLNIQAISAAADPTKKKPTPKRMGGPGDLLPGEKPEDKAQSMDEEQKMKRQRRLLKNREAAQQFRQRQKEYIQNLERKVTELNSHVGETHKHIELLATENRLLRDQLVYLYNVMRQNLTLSPTSPTASPSFAASITASPIPPPPAPPASIDLSLLGFKGYGVMDSTAGYEELLKSANVNATAMQMMGQSPAVTPAPSPATSPAITPSLTSPLTPRIPDLATLSIAKGMEMESCEGMSNPMLIARFGSLIKTDHEAQTVPELAVKTEGAGNM